MATQNTPTADYDIIMKRTIQLQDFIHEKRKVKRPELHVRRISGGQSGLAVNNKTGKC